MPTHIHLIVFDAEFNNEWLRQTINAMRQFTGRPLGNYCHDKLVLSPVEVIPVVYGQVISSPQRKDRANQFWLQSKRGNCEV